MEGIDRQIHKTLLTIRQDRNASEHSIKLHGLSVIDIEFRNIAFKRRDKSRMRFMQTDL